MSSIGFDAAKRLAGVMQFKAGSNATTELTGKLRKEEQQVADMLSRGESVDPKIINALLKKEEDAGVLSGGLKDIIEKMRASGSESAASGGSTGSTPAASGGSTGSTPGADCCGKPCGGCV